MEELSNMISASNVTLRLGKKALFEDVNIKFTEGNCYGLIGANGAGKSTFLKILSGALEPTNGDVIITPGQRLSVLEQDHFKYDDFTVLDTVIMGNARLYEIMKEKDASTPRKISATKTEYAPASWKGNLPKWTAGSGIQCRQPSERPGCGYGIPLFPDEGSERKPEG